MSSFCPLVFGLPGQNRQCARGEGVEGALGSHFQVSSYEIGSWEQPEGRDLRLADGEYERHGVLVRRRIRGVLFDMVSLTIPSIVSVAVSVIGSRAPSPSLPKVASLPTWGKLN